MMHSFCAAHQERKHILIPHPDVHHFLHPDSPHLSLSSANPLCHSLTASAVVVFFMPLISIAPAFYLTVPSHRSCLQVAVSFLQPEKSLCLSGFLVKL
jgi:hypothetical protein